MYHPLNRIRSSIRCTRYLPAARIRTNPWRGKATTAQPINQVPVIDIALLSTERRDEIVSQVCEACSAWGFFQIVNHGVPPETIQSFRDHTEAFFELPLTVKDRIRRSSDNPRGFFDAEYTKRKRDWKQGLDFGITPGCRSVASADFTVDGLPDDNSVHSNLDGFNRFPDEDELPGFRRAMWNYFTEMTKLAESVSQVMALGIGVDKDFFNDQLRDTHTSFLRLNYYPLWNEHVSNDSEKPLGISPHKDAGFLTLLLQDDGCHSLQVRNRFDNLWYTVEPIPGALTVNTGDMAQIWSNDKYYAPEHRVLANSDTKRYSAPYFYNPGYETMVEPVPTCVDDTFPLAYSPVNWGYFRWQRFAGDFADFGTEIQISDFTLKDQTLRQDARVTHQEEFRKKFDGGRTSLMASM